MHTNTSEAEKATGQTNSPPATDCAAATLVADVAKAAASKLTAEELARLEAVATYLESDPAAAGTPANRTRQAAKQLRLASQHAQVTALAAAYLQCLAESAEEIAAHLPTEPSTASE